MVTPELTVVVASFNRERYLGAALESVLGSSFENFTLLVVDDASTDGSVDLAESYARADKRVRVVVNEANLGQFPNRNRSLQMVTTPLLKYHDSDDLMYPHCLETFVTCLRSEPSAGFALSSGRAWSGGPSPMLLSPRLAYCREYLGGGLFHCGTSGAVFRTNIFRELGGFPEKGVPSDFYFWLSACATTPVLLVPGDLMWYRIHLEQELTSKGAALSYAAASGALWAALTSAGCPLTGDELVLAKRACVRRLLRLSLRDARAGRWRFVRERLKAADFRIRDLIRYPPKRVDDPMLGSALDENGEYAVSRLLTQDRAENRALRTM